MAAGLLPPSGILNRVLIAVQNPGALTKGTLEIVDAYYDIRHSFNNKVASFAIAGYSGADPLTIQNMPEEQAGAVYGAGDGSYALLDYQREANDHRKLARGIFQRLYLPRPEVRFCCQSDGAHSHRA